MKPNEACPTQRPEFHTTLIKFTLEGILAVLFFTASRQETEKGGCKRHSK
jgi:hypothetical protein